MFRPYIQTDFTFIKIKTNLVICSYPSTIEIKTKRKGEHTMKAFDRFVSKYPPGNDLRKPTAEMLEQFHGKLPAELVCLIFITANRAAFPPAFPIFLSVSRLEPVGDGTCPVGAIDFALSPLCDKVAEVIRLILQYYFMYEVVGTALSRAI